MNFVAAEFVWALLQATLAVSLTGVTLFALLAVLRVQSPWLHRAACVLVLLEGWCLIGWPVACDWPAIAAPIHMADSTRQNASASMPQVFPSGSEAPLLADFPAASPTTAVAARVSIRERSPALRADVATGPTRSSRTTKHARLSWPAHFTIAWAAGWLGLVGLMLWNYRRFVGSVAELEVHDPARHALWSAEWRSQLRAQHVAEDLPLVTTRGVGPALCRLPGGYRLLVPFELWSTLTAAQREAVLRHELAHYIRGDIWKSAAVRFLAALHWFNPIAWWVVRRFEESAEWACDERVRQASPRQVCELAQVLLQMGQAAAPSTVFSSPVWGRRLSGRIRRLVTKDLQEESRMKRCIIVLAMAVAGLGGAVRLQVEADEPQAQGTKFDAVPAETSGGPEAEEEPAEKVEAPLAASREAVIDLSRVFKEDVAFEEFRQNLLKTQRKGHGKALEQDVATIRDLERQLTQLRGYREPKLEKIQDLEVAIAGAKAGMQARLKMRNQALMQLEADNYSRSYERILDEVRGYAKEQSFRIVRRLSLLPQSSPKPVRIETAPGRLDDVEGLAIRPADYRAPRYAAEVDHSRTYRVGESTQNAHHAIMARMNQEVLYTTGESQAVDITDVIIKRLNAKTAEAKTDDKQ